MHSLRMKALETPNNQSFNDLLMTFASEMSPYLDALESLQDGRWPLDRKAIVAGCRDECKKAHLLEVGDRIWSRYRDLWSKDLLNLELEREVDGLRDAMDRCTAEVLRLESRIRELENPDI